MVAVAPFQALRYNLDAVNHLSRVVAPPYDVISPAQQERLYQASPYNVVRLILGKTYSTDTPEDNRYTRARQDFEAWCSQRILRRDQAPSMTLVEHTFVWEGQTKRRLGFLALLQLDERNRAGILRHEATLAAPKADRTRLLAAVPANLSPIFCVYPDAGKTVQSILERGSLDPAPWASATLGTDVIRVWIMTAPEIIREIQSRLADASVLIADGHHRFEVAYANRERYGALMSYFVSMEDPALAIQPIHRLMPSQSPKPLDALQALCDIHPTENLAALTDWLHENGPGRFGCYRDKTFYRVAVKPESLARWQRSPSVPVLIATLDVSLLHGLLFPHLGADQAHLHYTADVQEALQEADHQTSTTAWLLRGMPVSQVHAIAAQGLTLPPKSTFFYPKVLSGLAFNPFDDAATSMLG